MHSTQQVFNKSLQEFIPIDKQLAPIIKILWDLNINTEFCCQGSNIKKEKEEAHISFGDSNDAKKFIESIWNLKNWSKKGSLDNRIGSFGFAIGPPGNWQFEINNNQIGYFQRTGKVNFSTIIRFPNKDIPEILRRLKKLKVQV